MGRILSYTISTLFEKGWFWLWNGFPHEQQNILSKGWLVLSFHILKQCIIPQRVMSLLKAVCKHILWIKMLAGLGIVTSIFSNVIAVASCRAVQEEQYLKAVSRYLLLWRYCFWSTIMYSTISIPVEQQTTKMLRLLRHTLKLVDYLDYLSI